MRSTGRVIVGTERGAVCSRLRMQTSVAGEIAARVELFQQGFDFCRQGGFSFARFLALVPDRLRLALGDGGHRIRIPVTVSSDVVQQLRALLPTGDEGVRPTRISSPAELRRVVRLAQSDPSLHPIEVLAWTRRYGDRLLSLLGSLYERGFSEVGRGEGGVETAYLIHLVVVELLRRTLSDADAGVEAQVLMTTMVDAAVEGVLRSARIDDGQLSPRLGYQLAATRSPLAFGADADRIALRPVNAYRTVPRALQLARRVIQPPLEVIPLDRVAATVAKRLLVEPTLQVALVKDTLLEMVRDAALLAVVQSHRPVAQYGGEAPEAGDIGEVLGPLLATPTALVQHVFNHPRRTRLVDRLADVEAEAPKPIQALRRLLLAAPDVEQGDIRPLGVHGNLEERALLAARGAICLALESYTEDVKRDVNALVQWLEPDESSVAYQQGRCYRLGVDDKPLYRLPAHHHEAFMFVDAQELVRDAAERRPAALGDLVSRYLMTPLLRRLAALRSETPDALRIVHLGPDQVGFAGDVTLVVELAEAAQRVVAELQAELRKPVADVLGGVSNAVGETEHEIARLQHQIEVVDGALRRTPDDRESVQLLQDSRLMLERRLAALSEARRRFAGTADHDLVDVGIYITYGPAAVPIPLPTEVVATEGVWFSPFIIEARRGCARVPWVRDERLARVAVRRKARGGDAILPFALSLRERDDRSALFNAGCGISEAALGAFMTAKAAVLRFLELRIELRELPEDARRRFVFDRDPERFIVGVGRLDSELVVLFRAVGMHGEHEIWEILPADSPFTDVVVSLISRARERTA